MKVEIIDSNLCNLLSCSSMFIG